jgi:flagellin
MSTRINTNIEALNAQRNLSVTAGKYASSVEKLSSGLRINRAADDAAGLAISEKLQAQVTGLNQAQRNAQDGVSMVQTAEGALNEVHSMLQRVRELSVEAANSTLGQSDAQSVNAEVTALQAEITRIASTTTFNGQNLLTGALSVAQTGGTVGAGFVVAAGTNTSVQSVVVTGAKASTTYTLSTTGLVSGQLKLSDASGNSQILTLGAIAAKGSQTLNFANMGVSITVASVAGDSAANVAAGLAAGPGSPAVISIGGTGGTNLVNGTALAQASTGTVVGTGVSYRNVSFDGSSPMTATASAGVAPGTVSVWYVSSATGEVQASNGGENFIGTLAAPSSGADSSMVLTGDHGDTITINYKQGSAPTWLGQMYDLNVYPNDATFTFGEGTTAASVANMAAAPTASAGTYTFTSSGAGSLTLTGPGGAQTIAVADTAASTTQHLNFNNLGISFDIQANATPGGLTAQNAIGSLLQASNNSIVVNSTGGGPGPAGTLITGAGSGANFQVGANEGDTLGVTFADARTSAYTGFDAAIAAFTTAAGTGNGIAAAAGALITATDTAIGAVSTIRANFGAVENRLNHTVASINVASENLNASESRIKDLDVAAEMVNFTKTQILQQAGTSILAQANSAPQNILTLLR